MGFRLAPSNLTLDDHDGSKVNVKILDLKYLKNGDRYEVGRWKHLSVGSMGFRLALPDVTLDDLEG